MSADTETGWTRATLAAARARWHSWRMVAHGPIVTLCECERCGCRLALPAAGCPEGARHGPRSRRRGFGGYARWPAIEAAIRARTHVERSSMIDVLTKFMPKARRQAS